MAVDQKALIKDLKKYMYTFADEYCHEAATEITKIAKYAIEQFYNDYSPDYYDRTYDLRENSYSRYYHNNGRAIYGGVRINSEKMQPYNRGSKWETNPFEVASFAWHGWHGNPIRNIYTTPPLDIVKEGASKQEFLNKLREKAENVAKNQEYSILKFK